MAWRPACKGGPPPFKEGRVNTTDRKTYWRGYHAMKRLAYDYYDADRAYMEIYNSNASNEFVRGAERARKYIKRIGIRNLTCSR